MFPWPGKKRCKSSLFTHLPLIRPSECFLSSSLQNKVTSWIKYPVWTGLHLRSRAREARFDVITVVLLHLFGSFPSLPACQSIRRCVCSTITPSDRGGRPRPLFVTADMRQFSCVNDKRCANYLSGCFGANQTLTSCERVGVHVWAPQPEGRLVQALSWILMIRNCRDCGVEITFPLDLGP